ncbi:hypothetical protein TIFTF001_030129 [Ficus carica]|uniref:Uncharacterized protein n=1 Tax=Ficus carica TaxID=3494 RepID=A0AA88DTL1_FICCA|nr:hypothetical protein TIFTF001_030129 [Ficus carica]
MKGGVAAEIEGKGDARKRMEGGITAEEMGFEGEI